MILTVCISNIKFVNDGIFFVYFKLSTLHGNPVIDVSGEWISQKYGFHNGKKAQIIAYESYELVGIKDWVQK